MLHEGIFRSLHQQVCPFCEWKCLHQWTTCHYPVPSLTWQIYLWWIRWQKLLRRKVDMIADSNMVKHKHCPKTRCLIRLITSSLENDNHQWTPNGNSQQKEKQVWKHQQRSLNLSFRVSIVRNQGKYVHSSKLVLPNSWFPHLNYDCSTVSRYPGQHLTRQARSFQSGQHIVTRWLLGAPWQHSAHIQGHSHRHAYADLHLQYVCSYRYTFRHRYKHAHNVPIWMQMHLCLLIHIQRHLEYLRILYMRTRIDR